MHLKILRVIWDKMFGDDFLGGGIEDLFRKLSGGENFVEYSSVGPDGRKRISRRMQKDIFGKILLDKISTKKRIYFIFDFSGKTNVNAKVRDHLVEDDYGEQVATGNKILEVFEGSSVLGEYPVSEDLKLKSLESNFLNGILEVSFKK